MKLGKRILSIVLAAALAATMIALMGVSASAALPAAIDLVDFSSGAGTFFPAAEALLTNVSTSIFRLTENVGIGADEDRVLVFNPTLPATTAYVASGVLTAGAAAAWTGFTKAGPAPGTLNIPAPVLTGYDFAGWAIELATTAGVEIPAETAKLNKVLITPYMVSALQGATGYNVGTAAVPVYIKGNTLGDFIDLAEALIVKEYTTIPALAGTVAYLRFSARFVPQTYAIKFDAGADGTIVGSDPAEQTLGRTVTFGTAYGAAPVAAKAGYTFVGWNTSAAATAANYSATALVPVLPAPVNDFNQTYYAIYTKDSSGFLGGIFDGLFDGFNFDFGSLFNFDLGGLFGGDGGFPWLLALLGIGGVGIAGTGILGIIGMIWAGIVAAVAAVVAALVAIPFFSPTVRGWLLGLVGLEDGYTNGDGARFQFDFFRPFRNLFS